MADRTIQYDVVLKDKTKTGAKDVSSTFKKLQIEADKATTSIVKKFIGVEAIIQGVKKAADFAAKGLVNYMDSIGDTTSMDKLSTAINTINLQVGKELYPTFVQFTNFLDSNLVSILETIHRAFLLISGSIGALTNSIKVNMSLLLSLIGKITGNKFMEDWGFKEAQKASDEFAKSIDKIGKAFGEIDKGAIVDKTKKKSKEVKEKKEGKSLEEIYKEEALGLIDSKRTLTNLLSYYRTKNLEMDKNFLDVKKEQIKTAFDNELLDLDAFLVKSTLGEQGKLTLRNIAIKKYNDDIKQIDRDYYDERIRIREEFNIKDFGINGNYIGQALAQNQASYKEELDLYKKLKDQELITGTEYLIRANQATKDLQQQNFASVLEGVNKFADEFTSISDMVISNLSDISSTIEKNQLRSIDKWYNKEKSTLEMSVMNGRKRERELAKLEAEASKKREKAQKEAFERNKAMSMATAIINGAVAFTSALSTQPIWLGIALAAATAISTGIQVATIASQTFSKGGIVNGPEQGDTVNARLNGNEMVLTKTQQLNLFKMANGNGSGGGSNITMGDTIINGNVDQNTLDKLDARDQRNQEKMKEILRQMQFNGTISKGVLA